MNRGAPRSVRRPRPDLVRSPRTGFGWLEHALLHEGWLARIGTDGVAVLVLLALASDRHGASFFSRQRMATALGVSIQQVDAGLTRLRELELVDFAPWAPGRRDGVWQLLPVPELRPEHPRAGKPLAVATILAALGIVRTNADERRRDATPDNGAE